MVCTVGKQNNTAYEMAQIGKRANGKQMTKTVMITKFMNSVVQQLDPEQVFRFFFLGVGGRGGVGGPEERDKDGLSKKKICISKRSNIIPLHSAKHAQGR